MTMADSAYIISNSGMSNEKSPAMNTPPIHQPPVDDNTSKLTTSCITLSNGVSMPAVGYGTWRLKDRTLLLGTLQEAWRAGYRLFDTAQIYRNEGIVGEAIQSMCSCIPELEGEVEGGGISRPFITTKISPMNQGDKRAKSSVLASLDLLGVACIDLVLIHWPGTAKVAVSDTPALRASRLGSWRALQELYAQGKVRAIGVSNYRVEHLEELVEEGGVQPMVNQIEMHPLVYGTERSRALIAYCESKGIHVQAYASLGEGALVNGKVPLPVLEEMACRYAVSNAQVLLRWALQHGFSVLPKSTQTDRIRSNFQLEFNLTPEDMAVLDGLVGGDASRETRFCWDPFTIA